MIREAKKTTWLLWGLFAILLALSAATLDYSGLSTFSLAMGRDVLQGLSQPDWSFFTTVGRIWSLLLLTIGIACLGTMIATVCAIPVTLLSAANPWSSAPWVAKSAKWSAISCGHSRAGLCDYFCPCGRSRTFCWSYGDRCPPDRYAGQVVYRRNGSHGWALDGRDASRRCQLADDVFVRVPYLAPIYSSFALNHFEIAVRSAATLG